jgi:hypothetical protein
MPKNLQTLFVILECLRRGRLLTLESHSESSVLDRITFPDFLLSMHHKKLQVQDSASRFCSKASLIVGYIIIVTTQGGMHCLIILFVFGLLSWSGLMEMAVSVFLASLYSLPFWLRGHHPWVPLQRQSEHNCAGKKHQSDLTWSTSCVTT